MIVLAPPPGFDWKLGQTYDHLLLVHWEVDVDLLQSKLPDGVTVRTFQGKAYVGHDVLRVEQAHFRNVPPIPGLDSMNEVTLRTFVRFGDQEGLYLFSLDAPGHLMSWSMEVFFHLNAKLADVQLTDAGGSHHVVSARSDDASIGIDVTYAGTGAKFVPTPGSLDEFLLGGTFLIAADADGVYLSEERHGPWNVQRADVTLANDTIATSLGLGPTAPQSLIAVFMEEQTSYGTLPKRLG